jgi:hypothetical protein
MMGGMTYFIGMQGLGDNLYQRAVIRAMDQPVYLETAWPQLYADLQVLCVKPATTLRTQLKNIATQKYCRPPRGLPARRIGYGGEGSMLQSMCDSVGVKRRDIVFDGPPVVIPGRRPYVVVRPATVREEWRADARNPAPKYIASAADSARAAGYDVISIADLAEGREWAVEPLPFAHEQLHRGELGFMEMLGLVAGADGVIGGVGWLAPAAVAYHVPMLLLYGGAGGYNGPQRIFDSPMNLDRIVQVMPDNFCMCRNNQHTCDKTTTGLEHHIARFFRLIDESKIAMVA